MASFRNPLRIVSDSKTEMARVTHRETQQVEREEKAMTWARISNPLTVQFVVEILREKRRGQDLKKR